MSEYWNCIKIKTFKPIFARKPLCAFEFIKLRPFLMIVILILLLVSRAYYVNYKVGDMKNFEEARYYRYIADMQNMSPEERLTYLEIERDRLNSIIEDYELYKSQQENGDVTNEEYTAYLDLYYLTRTENIVFTRVEQYFNYIDYQITALEKDIDWIYTGGYEKFFGLNSDLFLYVAFVFLCIQCFYVEYKGGSQTGFSQILRSTKKGREKTFWTKIAVFVGSSVLLSLCFRGVTFAVVRNNYEMCNFDATLQSLESFSNVFSDISIGQYLLIDACIQMFSAALLAVLICNVSYLFKKMFAILTVTLLVTGIPELLERTILKRNNYSIVSLSSPRSIFCRSFQKLMFGYSMGYLITVCAIHLIIIGVMTWIVYQNYCGILVNSKFYFRRRHYEQK